MAEIPRTYTSETELTLLSDIYYRKEYQGQALMEVLAPQLIFDGLWPKVATPDYNVTIPVKSVSGTRYSDASDPRKDYAPPFEYGAKIPRVTVSGKQYKAYSMGRYALGFTIGLDARENVINMSQVAETRGEIAYWLAEQINAGIIVDVTNSFSVTNTDSTTMEDTFEHSTDYGVETTLGNLTGTIDSGYYWDEAGGDPVTDVMDLKLCFENQAGWPFQLTDLYMTMKAANLISKFVVRSGGTWAKDPTSDGYMTNKVAGVSFHALKGDTAGWTVTVGDDYIMGLDRARPAARTYYHVSSELSSVGQMNVDSWYEPESKNWNYDFIFARKTVLHEPLGLCILKVRD